MRSLTHRSALTAPPSSKVVEVPHSVPLRAAIVYFLTAFTGCAADLATKHWIFAWRGVSPGKNDVWWIIEGYVGIETAVNYGALFGMGQGYSHVFVILSFIALAGVIYWLFVAGAAYDRLLTFALGMITGGIVGNLYDRLGFWSVPGVTDTAGVRDWIRLSVGEYTWPNFNVADSLLVCGAALLVWHSFQSGAAAASSGAKDR